MSRVNPTIEAATHQNIENILCTEEEERNRTSPAYRWIGRLAKYCGTLSFLALNAALFAAWVSINTWWLPFDPYPFTFLLFGVSLEAIFLSILILISQNLDAAESERRHHLDLQMNVLSERELTALMRLAVEIAERVGVPDDDTKEVRSFAHETDPSGVFAQIVRAERKHHLRSPGC